MLKDVNSQRFAEPSSTVPTIVKRLALVQANEFPCLRIVLNILMIQDTNIFIE